MRAHQEKLVVFISNENLVDAGAADLSAHLLPVQDAMILQGRCVERRGGGPKGDNAVLAEGKDMETEELPPGAELMGDAFQPNFGINQGQERGEGVVMFRDGRANASCRSAQGKPVPSSIRGIAECG